MTRETKAGLLMIVMLAGVFGVMVHKRMHQPAAAMAQQNPPGEQQPPAELPDGPAEPADPFLSTAGDFATSSRIIHAAESVPADESPTRRAAADRPVRSQAASETDPFERQQVISRPSKPKLPTAVPDDFVDRDLDGRASRDSSTPVTALPGGSRHPAQKNETQKYGSRGSSTQLTAAAARPIPVPDALPKSRTDDFNSAAQPVRAVSARDDQSQPEFADASDPFAQSDNRVPAAFDPPVAVNSQRQDFADSDPFEAQSQKSAAPTQVIESGVDDAFDRVPAKSAVPARNSPSRDDFGGNLPARANNGAVNEFGGNERPVPSHSRDAAPRRVARPAPVTQIDEDFGARSSARPLIAGDNYLIEPSDNFWTISRKKYGTGRYFMALAQHNALVITDPKRMKPGVIIATPSAESLERAYPQLIPKPAAVDPVQTAQTVSVAQSTFVPAAEPDADAGYFVSNDGTPMFRVGKEDTLSGIAQRHLGRSSRWVQVYEMNRDVLTDGNTLKIGAVLRLPADASRVDVVAGGRTFR